MQDFPLSITCNWQPQTTGFSFSSVLSSWLYESGSLTARLKSRSTSFEVQVLNESRVPVTPEQGRLLNTQASTLLNREVLLICDDQPMVYAQSWIPSGAQVAGESLDGLGSRPLGEVIFTEQSLSRQMIEVGYFEGEHDVAKLSRSLDFPEQALWGRRSIFTLQQENILVCEIFLPCSYPYL